MKASLTSLLPPDTRTIAMPNWREPRFLMPDTGAVQRWRQAALYPAGRWQGRVLRELLRISTAAGLGATCSSADTGWAIGKFVGDTVPSAVSSVAWVGPPGPAQKATLELRDSEARVVAYVKYAETQLGLRRLEAERLALAALPPDVGPTELCHGPLLEGEALCVTPVLGCRVPAGGGPPRGLIELLASLSFHDSRAASEHPWLLRIASASPVDVTPWLAALGDRPWDVVFLHGDLAPWNTLVSSNGAVRLVDWEHATEDGFPFVDLAYWMLQVGCLVRRSKPARTFSNAASYIRSINGVSLSCAEARVIVRLAALMAYEHASEDGHAPTSRAQAWRRAVWECDIA